MSTKKFKNKMAIEGRDALIGFTGSSADTFVTHVENGETYYISEHWLTFDETYDDPPLVQACFGVLNQTGHVTIQKMAVVSVTVLGFVCRIYDKAASGDVHVRWMSIGEKS